MLELWTERFLANSSLLLCGLSVEEAKKKIYACSTTTYNGFQVEVSEEMSEKFNGECL